MAVAGDTGADAELLLPTVLLSLDTNSAKEEALPTGSTEERYFKILGQAEAKVFVSFKEGPKLLKHDSCCCSHYLYPKGYYTFSVFLT